MSKDMAKAKRFFQDADRMFEELAEERTDEGARRVEVRSRAERRERIATAVAAGIYAAGPEAYYPKDAADIAANVADALIAELDRREATELQEAR